MSRWLMKSEPGEFSVEDLRRSPKGISCWDGVRNYQARNMMRDDMRRGDEAFFYHSNCPQPAIVGVMKVVREGYPDHTAFAPNDHHYDPGSKPDSPRWFMVDVAYLRHMKRPVTLAELRCHEDRLPGLPLLRRGNRLSVMPVDDASWKYILRLEKKKPEEQA